MNIPMYGAVKRCTPLVNLILAVVILRHPFPSFTLIVSVLTITIGCFVAVLGDLTFDAFAYTMGGLSVLAQGLYLTLVQQCAENKRSTWEILQLNSYNTLAPFIIMSVLVGEPENIIKSKYIADIGFHIVFWILVSMGSVLNYSLFLCTVLNSALTTSLVAVAKSVIQTLVGLFVFGGIKFHPLNTAGIVMNTLGGFMYTYTKYQEKIEDKRQKTEDENFNEVKVGFHPLSVQGTIDKSGEHSLNDIKSSSSDDAEAVVSLFLAYRKSTEKEMPVDSSLAK
ncbi:Solute carrier family 35 member D3 [Portunus trituberculatus]|uniref:Solute carrier family 35 member D3 n=1 Tax=Portunus trituberculatus TaxID=210409 RepID=A0A5B7D269_PORTR|nr:Solute carrier family 35 member D3 [Portunus trituberculatus]